MSTEAFDETLQFVTNVNLNELGKRHQAFSAHASEVLSKPKACDDIDPIGRLSVLVESVEEWSGSWFPDMNFGDIKRYIEQARIDPGFKFPRAVLEEWTSKAVAQIEHEGMHYYYAQLFGKVQTRKHLIYFATDKTTIDGHIIELRRHWLAATTSVFGWVPAYKKYMTFVVRNCGEPAVVYGKAHIDEIIDTLARIQNAALFSSDLARGDKGVRQGGIRWIPYGWYLRLNSAGGLEGKSAEEILKRAQAEDEREYAEARRRWENAETNGRSRAHSPMTLKAVLGILENVIDVSKTGCENDWSKLSPYWQWVIGLHHDVMVEKFGSLAIVEPTSVLVGMVSVFKGSRMKWEQEAPPEAQENY
ncbi:hypothetical protein M0805_001304 [Coniferiporia weirii]|nr:hypothetical protein M0805_001304 [Coniferiporia weirii]